MITVNVYEKDKSWRADLKFEAPTYGDVCVITSVLRKYGTNVGKIEVIDELEEGKEGDAASGTVSA